MLYAIVKTGDKQFHVEKGMKIDIPLLDAQPGDQIELNEVLLCSNGNEVVVGTPLVEDALVKATFLGEAKGKKIDVFKMKRRKKYRRKTGHRQTYSAVKITDIIAPISDPEIAEIEEPDTETQEDQPGAEQTPAEQAATPDTPPAAEQA